MTHACIHLHTDVDEYNAFSVLSQENTRILMQQIELRNEDDIEAVMKVKDFYLSCNDTDAVNDRGVQPLLDLIRTTGY